MGGTNSKMVQHMKKIMTKLVENDKPYQDELIQCYIAAMQSNGGSKPKAQEFLRNKICADLVNMTAPALASMAEESRMNAAQRDSYAREQKMKALIASKTPAMQQIGEDQPIANPPAATAAPATAAAADAKSNVSAADAAALADAMSHFKPVESSGSDKKSAASGPSNAHWRLARAFLTAVTTYNGSERDLHLSREDLKKCMLESADTLVKEFSEKESTKEAAVLHDFNTAVKNVDMAGLSF